MSNEQVALVQGYSYDPTKGLAVMLEVAQKMIDDGLCPPTLNQPGQLITIAEMGKSLGVDWVTAINSIDNIQGRPSLSFRFVGALLNRAGYEVKIVKDYEPQYDTAGNLYNYVTEMEIVNLNLMGIIRDELEKIKDLPEDVRKVALTMFEEYPKLLKRNFQFTWLQAQQAGLLTKTNYISRPIEMFRARCLTGMARMYAPQVLLSFYETSELHDVVPETTGGNGTYTTCEVVN